MKTLEFTYEDKDYVLEYNLKSIKEMERQGLDLQKAEERAFSTVVLMFKGAFIKNHGNVSEEKIEEIISMLDKDELFYYLAEMFNEVIEKVTASPKNALKWKKNG